MTLLPFITPVEFLLTQAVSVAIVAVPSVLGLRAAYRNNVQGMSRWSFWLFVIWLWSGFSRLAFSPDWTMMLWAPMVIVAVALAISHIYMEGLRKGLVGGIKASDES